jgi:hypothetical protein
LLYSFIGHKITNSTIPSNWKRAIVVPIYKGGDGLVVSDYKLISLTTVVCMQMEHIIASYLMKLWDKKDWLFVGQHGFKTGYQW